MTTDPEASGALPPPPEFLPRATSAELPLENQVRLDTAPQALIDAPEDHAGANQAATPIVEAADELEVDITTGDNFDIASSDNLDIASGDEANESMEVELPTDFGSADYDPAESVELPVDLDGSDERVPVHNTMPAVEVSKSYPTVDSPSPSIPRARVRAFGDPLVTQPPRSMALWFGIAIALVVVGVGAWMLTRGGTEPPATASVASTTRPDAAAPSGPGSSPAGPAGPPSPPEAAEPATEPTRSAEVSREASAQVDPPTSVASDSESAAGSDTEDTPSDAALGAPSTSAPTDGEPATDDATSDDATSDDAAPDGGVAPTEVEPPPRTTPAPTLAPGEDPANDPAYRRAAERYAQTEAPDALLEMTLAGCALREGPLARAAFRKLRGRPLRSRAIVECRELGIDVTAKTTGYTGPELLAQAERALEAGDVQTAFDKAQASNKVSRSNAAIQLRARTACTLGNAAEARRMLPHISKKSRPAVIAHCREAGIDLPS